MRFTLSYTEGNEVDRPKAPKGFDSIQEAKEWCDLFFLAYYLFVITEWENLEAHEDSHDIVATCNFEEPMDGNWEDLSKAINY